MKAYQRRFITLTLSLIATVLLIVMTALAVYVYHQNYADLETTMALVLSPLDAFSQPRGEKPLRPQTAGEAPDWEEDALEPPEKPEQDEMDDAEETIQPKLREGGMNRERTLWELRDYAKQITAVICENGSGFTVLSGESEMEEAELASAVAAAKNAQDAFGKLPELKLYYYKVENLRGTRIAFADTAYISKPMLNLVLTLLLVFVLAMLAFFFVSYQLSKLAVKPLEQSVAMEKQFVADISHDLKTPITVILANTSILKDNPDSTVAEQQQWVESTEDSAHSMLKMINEMLTLSSMDSPQLQVACERIDLSEIVAKAALQMESVAFERGVLLESDIPDGVFVHGNADYAARICASLLENALKYEPDGGDINVRLDVHKKKAILEVQNESTVIAPADLPHIFERFYRVDKSRSEQKGHGLGLSIVKRMTELTGAEITVRSETGIGTVFAVTFELEA